ncbi:hypothetical protein HPB49_004096 [Dermacentor silvarum]|uniref:Uncharacterized protein n=1 Tax=Dermacentor silvarum TaxID=543639 RepID=A0ACB8DU55_DERSI|nr:hypothetical protein HPB49_004096 [Dermacentor silvarum]
MASEASLARLEKYVRVKAQTDPVTKEFLKQFSVVLLIEAALQEQECIAAFAHENISLIVVDTRGLAEQIFCGFVTCLDEMWLGFENRDYVTFSEVKGMTMINNCPPMKVKILSLYTCSVGDAVQFSDYNIGGMVTQVKGHKIEI